MHDVGSVAPERLALRRARGPGRRRDCGQGLDSFADFRSFIRGFQETSFALQRERAGLGLVRLVLGRSAGLGVDHLGGLAKAPLAISCQTLERGGKGTREEPLVRNRPKRDARATPPRRSGRMAPDPRRAIPCSLGFGPLRRMTGPSFLRQVAGSGQLAPGPNRPKREELLFQSADTDPFCQTVGAPPPPLKRHSSLQK